MGGKIICKLNVFLKDADMSVTEFCKRMYISRGTYYEWINGNKMPSLDNCYNAKNILEVVLGRLIAIEELWVYDEYR